MQLNWLFLIFLIFGWSQAKAQFLLGVTGGINISNVQNENVPGNSLTFNKSVVYQYVGVTPMYQFGEKFSVSSSIQFSQKGYQQKNVKFKHRASYLDFIPKIQYSPINAVTIGVGVFGGFKIGEKWKFKEENWQTPAERNNNELFADVDYGLTGSIQINLKRFFLMVGYNYGLNRISSTLHFPNAVSEKFSKNIQIGGGYIFDFEKTKE